MNTIEAHARTLSSLSEVSREAWDSLANPPTRPFNPFVSWDFLQALEESASAAAETGWGPFHTIIEDSGQLRAAAPAYLKSHSYGEFVFDHGWAAAFERAGGRYYPKLQVSAPFTPATGPRLLVADGADKRRYQSALGAALADVAGRHGLSSAHVTFLEADEQSLLSDQGWLVRHDQQFHFVNRGYADFDAFLEALASRKRKNLRKERARAIEAGIHMEWVTGADLSEAHWDAFYQFYIDTGSRKWGRPYLTRTFFSMIGQRMADRILLVMAKRAGRYIAGALNFIGGDALYGRHWGCVEDHPFLHFEVCYYQAIDFALAKGLTRVEAGAQGAHKIARGYEPCIVRSAHWITHDGFRDAVARYLDEERRAVAEEAALLGEMTPFKRDA